MDDDRGSVGTEAGCGKDCEDGLNSRAEAATAKVERMGLGTGPFKKSHVTHLAPCNLDPVPTYGSTVI